MSTIDEVIAKYKKVAEEIEKDNKPLARAAASVLKEMAVRIFEEGKNSDGNAIGTYSKKPIRINTSSPGKSPKQLPGKGKNGETKKKNGEPYKTTFFANYSEFKKAIDRAKGGVNFLLMNELRLDFNSSLNIKSPNVVEFKLKKDINADKVEGLQANFGIVFKLTKSERDEANRVYSLELLNIFKNA